MRKTTIICDTCNTEFFMGDGWNDPYFMELREHVGVSTSNTRLLHHFCSDSCLKKFLVRREQ